MYPQIIVLDGPSGSGKTALAKAMQEEFLPRLWLNISIDSLVYALPDSVLERCNKRNDWTGIDNNAIFSGAFSCVDGLAKSGGSVIFDVVITSEKRAVELMKAFGEYEPFVIGVRCDWNEIKRRTLGRGDRTLEEAEYGFNNSPAHLKYDFTIDTTNLAPLEATRKCIKAVRGL